VDEIVCADRVFGDVFEHVPVVHGDVGWKPVLMGCLAEIVVEAVELGAGVLVRDVYQPSTCSAGDICDGAGGC